jgi:hypothetical protein
MIKWLINDKLERMCKEELVVRQKIFKSLPSYTTCNGWDSNNVTKSGVKFRCLDWIKPVTPENEFTSWFPVLRLSSDVLWRVLTPVGQHENKCGALSVHMLQSCGLIKHAHAYTTYVRSNELHTICLNSTVQFRASKVVQISMLFRGCSFGVVYHVLPN